MRKKLLIFLAISMLLLCSCSFGFDVNDAIISPKPSGEFYEIQQTLEKYAGQAVSLVYPSKGEFRSPIILRDVDKDGKREAFSFYSTNTDENTSVLHINFIRWFNNEWVSVSDIEVVGSGVESVQFETLDKSGVAKIIVCWNRFTDIDRHFSVFSIDKGIMSEVLSADYSVLTTNDFDNDGIKEIAAVHLNREEKTATASLLSLSESGITVTSTCELDGTVTGYYEPKISHLTDGSEALFIDAQKSTGVITEVIYIKDNKLVNAFASKKGKVTENLKTLRASTVMCGDYYNDGSIDIPLASKLPLTLGMAESDAVYLTIWNRFDGKELTPFAQSLINYTDGYFFNVPDAWVGEFTVLRRLDLKQRIIYRWDNETAEIGEEIMRIQLVSKNEWNDSWSNYEQYFEIGRNADYVYAVRFGNSALNPGTQFVTDNFGLIAK